MFESRAPIFLRVWLDSPKYRIVISSLAGGLAYGCWALYINGGPNAPDAIRAALVQGIYSVAVTASFSGMMEWMMTHFNKNRKLFSVMVPSILLLLLSYSLHLINGTPRPLPTLLPGYLMSMMATITYVFVIEKTELRENPSTQT